MMFSRNKVPNKQKDVQAATPVESAFDWMGAAAVALIVVSLIFSLFCRVVNVSGDSMTNTLLNGEKLLLSGLYTNISYGDIVVIRRENDTPLIKRVVGLPGDVISINDSNGKVYRNSTELDEPYVRGGHTPSRGLPANYVVPEGGIFVLGDNRQESLDSRILRDQIRMEDIVGVVTYRLNPFQSLRSEG